MSKITELEQKFLTLYQDVSVFVGGISDTRDSLDEIERILESELEDVDDFAFVLQRNQNSKAINNEVQRIREVMQRSDDLYRISKKTIHDIFDLIENIKKGE